MTKELISRPCSKIFIPHLERVKAIQGPEKIQWVINSYSKDWHSSLSICLLSNIYTLEFLEI